MEKAKLRVRKWGNSFGIVLPRTISDQPVKEGMEIEVTLSLNDKTKVEDVFGILKGKLKRDTEEVMNEIDKELWGVKK